MVISLGLCDRPALAGNGCSRLSTSASHLITVGSEIAAGRIALFSRFASPRPGWFLLLSHRFPGAPIWTVDRRLPASLAFARHLCSAQLGLSSSGGEPQPATILSPVSFACQRAGRAKGCCRFTVPKGRFELPRVAPLRPERSASADSATSACSPGDSSPPGADLGTRTPDLLFTKELLYQLS